MPSERKIPGKASKWIVYYTDANGKRNSKSFDTKAKANGFEKQEKEKGREKRRPVTSGNATFGDLVNAFIEDSKVGRDGGEPWKENTLNNTEDRLARIYEHFIPVGTLLRTMDLDFMKDVRKSIQGSHYARKSQVTYWNLIKSIMVYGKLEKWLNDNPCEGMVIKTPKVIQAVGEEKLEVFTKEEVAKIVIKAQELSEAEHGQTRRAYKDTWLLVPLLFETGARINELLALPWTAVDFEQEEVRIAQNQSRGQTLQLPKTQAGHRTITISGVLMERLKELYQRSYGKDFVFMTSTGKRFQYRNMLRWFHNLLEKAGVEESGFHKARHYYASRLIEAGVDPKVLTTNLGHTDVAFTMNVYGHLFHDRDTREKKRAVAAQLATLEAA